MYKKILINFFKKKLIVLKIQLHWKLILRRVPRHLMTPPWRTIYERQINKLSPFALIKAQHFPPKIFFKSPWVNFCASNSSHLISHPIEICTRYLCNILQFFVVDVLYVSISDIVFSRIFYDIFYTRFILQTEKKKRGEKRGHTTFTIYIFIWWRLYFDECTER